MCQIAGATLGSPGDVKPKQGKASAHPPTWGLFNIGKVIHASRDCGRSFVADLRGMHWQTRPPSVVRQRLGRGGRGR